ncbi:MAG TPA: PilN domain-containing protein [Solirubrobacteraceae bacterium]|jgi:Tfp pilus assembly protein PilN|nr:PilN domain-containing protein [Solirubrobacteraceae bacterium]
MRAVNLIPADAKRASRGSSGAKALPTYLVLGVLAIAVGLVTLYVLASNDVSQREAKVTTLQAEVAQVQARSNGLSHYAQFSQMTQGRVSSVRQLATTRFDWHATLAQISQVVPKNTSLATLNGAAVTALPTTGSTATATAAAAPAGTTIELTGCTKSQPDVAKLMSRLRLIDGVNSVSLSSSTKQESGGSTPASGSASSGSASGGSAQGCGNNTPTFDLKIGFASQPATPAAGAATSTSTSTSAAPSTSGGAS